MSEPNDAELPVPVAAPAAPPRRQRGRPKTRIRSEIPIRILAIDFKQPPADQILPCSDLEQAADLGWSVDDIRGVNQSHGLYTKLPMICKGPSCFWAKQCPTAPEYLFQDFACPLQIMEAYSRFVELVRELEITPDDSVDLDMIADLVRIDLRLKQIDMQLAVEGLMMDAPIGIAQKTGEVAWGAKVAHPLLAVQTRERGDRNKLYDKLIATRDAKKKAAAVEGKQENDLLKLFEQAMAKGNQYLQRAQSSPGEIIDVTPSPLPAGDPSDEEDEILPDPEPEPEFDDPF